MAFSFPGSGKVTFSAAATTRTFTLPTVADGDCLVIQTVIPSGTGTISPSGTLTGVTETYFQTVSGHRHSLWIREGLTAADSGLTVTFTTSTSYKTSVQWAVVRGGAVTSIVDVALGANGPAGGGLSMTSPAVTTTVAGSMEMQFVGHAGAAGVTAFTVPAGMTVLQEIHDPTAVGGAGGATGAVIGYNLTGLPAGSSAGGDVWGVDVANLLSAFTVTFEPASVATTVRPSSTVSSTAWTVSGASSVHAALSDETDASYVESGDNPAGTLFEVGLPPIATGDITVAVRMQQAGATPSESVAVSLRQGATQIAVRTYTLTTAWTTYQFTTTSAETAAITDRSALRVRAVATAGA
jgi:hypothetical protein